MKNRGKIDQSKLKKTAVDEEEVESKLPEPVSAGAVEKAMDLAFNPTREKIREVTIIDRMQGRLFPLLDIINAGRQHILEIAIYRQDAGAYEKVFKQKRPILPNLLDEFMYRTAQWQKSVQGMNLTKITDIALAETEARVATEEDKFGVPDTWGKD